MHLPHWPVAVKRIRPCGNSTVTPRTTPMTLLIVRHAHARKRDTWTKADRRRPLSAKGRSQSEALSELYASQSIDRILSSPAQRCVDTVRPFAEKWDVPLIEDDMLLEGTPFDVIDRLLRRCSVEDVLLCSHGDVISSIVTALERRGSNVPSSGWPKASAWILDSWPDPTQIRFVPAPMLT